MLIPIEFNSFQPLNNIIFGKLITEPVFLLLYQIILYKSGVIQLIFILLLQLQLSQLLRLGILYRIKEFIEKVELIIFITDYQEVF